MTRDRVPALSVDADLRLLIDGSRTVIDAKGQQVTVRTDNVGKFLSSAMGSARALPEGSPSIRDLIAMISKSLDDLGLSARIVGPRGTVVEVGHRSPSHSRRRLLGSQHFRLGSATALAQAASQYVLASNTLRRRFAIATAAGVVTLISSRLRSGAGRTPT